jgi:predicted nuclease of predicted toxin-antitoxin system
VRVLFDQGTPVPLRDFLQQQEVKVTTAFERGWSELQNGELLDAAEREGFAVFVTTDTKLKFQQNLAGRRITIEALLTTSWPRIERATAEMANAIAAATPGSCTEVSIP